MIKYMHTILYTLAIGTMPNLMSADNEGFNPGDRSPTTSEVALAVGDVYSKFENNRRVFEGMPNGADFMNDLKKASRLPLTGKIPEAIDAILNARMLAVIGGYPAVIVNGHTFSIEKLLDEARQGKNPFAIKKPVIYFDY